MEKKNKLNNPTSPTLRQGYGSGTARLRGISAKPRIAVGMSGGVDSAVAAAILKRQGYNVVGFMMKFWSEHPSACGSRGKDNACCDIDGLQDAKRIAVILNIPFYVIDVREKFKHEIVDYFIEEYKNLRTPNPCVKCNEKIKFGWMLDFAKSVGCQYLATGHYSRITSESPITKKQSPVNNQLSISNNQNITSCHPALDAGSRNYCIDSGSRATGRNDNIRYYLLKGKDENKDQSYFLYRLNQEQLSKIIFPVGEYTKSEVRAMAKKFKLPVHEKRESQEICFVAENDYRQFLRRHIPAKYFKPGQIVDTNGNVIGEHEGLINYTIGQRKGVEQVSSIKYQVLRKDKQPLYVVGFDAKKNQLIVGRDEEIYRNEMIVGDLSWINSSCQLSVISYQNLKVKIRYRHKAVACKIIPARHPEFISGSRNYNIDSGSPHFAEATRGGQATGRNDKIVVRFNEPQRAITPGQSAVFYSGDEVLGGGIIS